MLNRTLSAVALLTMLGTTVALTPTAAADQTCTHDSALNMVMENPFSWTIDSLESTLEAWGCPEGVINTVLCEVFADAYCSGLPPGHDPVVHAVNGYVRDVESAVSEEHGGIEAGGIAIIYDGKTGVQYKDRCGTAVERQFSCRATPPTLPAMPSFPSLPAPPPSPVTFEITVGPFFIQHPGCEFWAGDLNCL